MPSCMVKTCTFSWREKDQDVTLHVFPRNPDMIAKWLRKIHYEEHTIEELTNKILGSKTGGYRICSRHFTESDYEQRGPSRYLKKDAFPTPYSLKEPQRPASPSLDHSYVKRMRLEVEPPGETSLSISVAAQEITGDLSIAKNIFPKAGSHSISELLFFDMGETDHAECEIETTGERSLTVSNTSPPPMPPIKRKYSSRSTRTVGTFMDFINTKKNKATQFEKRFGTSNKKTQVCCRKDYNSVGIQCNLVELPGLQCLPVKQELAARQHTEMKLQHDVWQHSFPKGRALDSQSAASYEHFAVGIAPHLPELSPFHTFPAQEMDNTGQLLMDCEPEDNLEPLLLNESYRPTLKEEDHSIQTFSEDEDLFVDPKNPDNSFVLLHDVPGKTDYAAEAKFLVFHSCLDELLWNSQCKAVSGCSGTIIKLHKYMVGSALVVNGFCSNNHKYRLWVSQPFIGRMPVGNLLLSAAIVCSGSNYQTMTTFFDNLSMPSISKTTHCQYQQNIIFPIINFHWQEERQSVIKSLGNKAIALAGHSQCDPSGYNAKYCTYTLMDVESKKIVDFQVEQFQTGVSSVTLENKAFQITLERLLADDVNIKVITTDRHIGIRKTLQKIYQPIKHEFDVWHFGKSVSSKLIAASKSRNMRQLAHWVPLAKKHLWWCFMTCHHNPELLKEKWLSFIYHSANVHQWPDNSMYHSCQHPPISAEEGKKYEWLSLGSAAHQKLKEIVQNPQLLRDLQHLSHCSHTDSLDVYNRMSLKYRSKGHHFHLDAMVALTQLAALDHNKNTKCLQALVSKLTHIENVGTSRYRYSYNRVKNDWLVSNVYSQTTQKFIKDILSDSLSFAAGKKHFHWQERPSRVPQNIAPGN
ncbi:uncharacterized protein [Aquarana catesbeiana]|uniref:uncharacterized protein n=1 Tax=Aquarana catesbeiana TaxID=8400 RepID=UPI003CC97453